MTSTHHRHLTRMLIIAASLALSVGVLPSRAAGEEPIRFVPGGEISEPKLIDGTLPRSTIELRRLRPVVFLEAVVQTDGSVRDVKIDREASRDVSGFGRAVQEALATWRFEPARRNGEAVPVIYGIAIGCGVSSSEEPILVSSDRAVRAAPFYPKQTSAIASPEQSPAPDPDADLREEIRGLLPDDAEVEDIHFSSLSGGAIRRAHVTCIISDRDQAEAIADAVERSPSFRHVNINGVRTDSRGITTLVFTATMAE